MRHRVDIHVEDFSLRADLHVAADHTNLQRPVVLLHGLSQQRRFWDPVLRRMSARPVLTLDQRGHGDSDTDVDVDYSVAACADDVVAALDLQGWDKAVVVGHSWGAFVAHHVAASRPERVASFVLIDGGTWALSPSADRPSIRERLRPPAIALPEDDLWKLISSGVLGPHWSPELQAALTPTFTVGSDGLMRTRIGMDRHMLVLDGLLNHDPGADLARVNQQDVDGWVVRCGDTRPQADFIDVLFDHPAPDSYRVLHWPSAIHDVPLQWPALVAGLIDEAAQEGTW